MSEKLLWVQNKQLLQSKNSENVEPLLEHFTIEQVKQVENFHRTYRKFKKTPLQSLACLADYVGINAVFIKDESYRFGLNAFKVLGGVYAVGKYVAKLLGKSIQELSFEELKLPKVKEQLGDLTFISTTDGNHGRGVAWAARELGFNARIYMPAGSAMERLQNIQKEGAYAEITHMNYDDTVRYTSQLAKENGWVIVQDTMWDGYKEIPLWIMQGYTTLIKEVVDELENAPTHVFLQAGVGSFASAMIAFLQQYYKEDITFVLVEPHVANCYYESFKQGTEQAVNVGGAMHTIMAGLACGEPSPIAWDILKTYTHISISCAEEVAATGMRVLGSPLGTDARIIAGESGAAPAGCLFTIMTDAKMQTLKETLQLNPASRVLLINTEGDTDAKNYREIMWHGAYPTT